MYLDMGDPLEQECGGYVRSDTYVHLIFGSSYSFADLDTSTYRGFPSDANTLCLCIRDSLSGYIHYENRQLGEDVQFVLQNLLHPIIFLYHSVDDQGVPTDKGTGKGMEIGTVVGDRLPRVVPHSDTGLGTE